MPPDGGLLYGLGVADLRADPWLFYMLITTIEATEGQEGTRRHKNYSSKNQT